MHEDVILSISKKLRLAITVPSGIPVARGATPCQLVRSTTSTVWLVAGQSRQIHSSPFRSMATVEFRLHQQFASSAICFSSISRQSTWPTFEGNKESEPRPCHVHSSKGIHRHSSRLCYAIQTSICGEYPPQEEAGRQQSRQQTSPCGQSSPHEGRGRQEPRESSSCQSGTWQDDRYRDPNHR